MQLRRQGVVKDNLKVGSFALIQRDRGWLEFLGGQGVFSVVKKVVRFGHELGFNSIIVYVSIFFFISGCLFLVVCLI